MKLRKIAFLVFLFLGFKFYAQVGIGTSTPNAQLDIQSTNQATPANTDGILIPKVDVFPATNPTLAQQGMLVYLNTATTFGGNPKPIGFYYWNNTPPDWIGISSAANGDHDWYKVGTALAPTAIIDDMFHTGNVAIGKNTANSSLDVETNGNKTSSITNTFNVSGVISQERMGINNSVTGSTDDPILGLNNYIQATSANGQALGTQNYTITNDGTSVGTFNNQVTNNGITYGVLNGGGGSYISFGVVNDLNSNTQEKTGELNALTATGTSTKGVNNIISDTFVIPTASQVFGVDNELFGNFPTPKTGIRNTIYGIGNADHIGVDNNLYDTGNGNHYGIKNSLSATGSGIKYGLYNNISSTSGSNQFGTYSILTGGTTGDKKGHEVQITVLELVLVCLMLLAVLQAINNMEFFLEYLIQVMERIMEIIVC
jgi:trimeric autotransporter adhesin